MRASYLPTISELQAFLACARHGTTTRAAQALNLTQSAVSRSVGTLEERLGVQLFDRVRRRLVLSDAGRGFAQEAQRLLDGLDGAALTAMAFGGHSEVLRLAVLPSLGQSWLVPRLAGFQARAPRVTFDISARLAPVDFETEPFDAELRRVGTERPGVVTEVLFDEQLLAVAAPGLAGTGPHAPETLARLPLLQQSTRPSLWLDWFRDAGVDPRTATRGARFDHFGMVLEAAIAGLGVGLVPALLAEPDLREGRLVVVSDRRHRSPTPYALIFPERSLGTPSLRAFRDWLIAGAEQGAPARRGRGTGARAASPATGEVPPRLPVA